jgi:integrase
LANWIKLKHKAGLVIALLLASLVSALMSSPGQAQQTVIASDLVSGLAEGLTTSLTGYALTAIGLNSQTAYETNVLSQLSEINDELNTISDQLSAIQSTIQTQTCAELTIGRYPEINASIARSEALQLRDLIRHGGDPIAERQLRRSAPTIKDLFDDYMERHAKVYKRPSSVVNDESHGRNFIVPKLGKVKVANLTRRDVETFHQSMRDRPYRANRVLSLLSKMMNLAKRWDWRGDNPCQGVPRFPEERRDRWLSTEEIERLCDALDKYPIQSTANAVRLTLLTGARRGEILSARWEDFNLELGVWTKPSHHTKQKRTEHVPLSAGALQMVSSMKENSTSPFLFPGDVPDQPLQDIKKTWAAVCKAANLEGVRLHDLRHTYASHLVSAGMSLPIVGRLLGHTQPQTTARYAHLADDPLRQATDRFASIVAAARSRKRADVVPIRKDG